MSSFHYPPVPAGDPSAGFDLRSADRRDRPWQLMGLRLRRPIGRASGVARSGQRACERPSLQKSTGKAPSRQEKNVSESVSETIPIPYTSLRTAFSRSLVSDRRKRKKPGNTSILSKVKGPSIFILGPMVEVGGVEPPSESISTGTSPGADGHLHSLAPAQAVTLWGSVAS